jgi:hypothetical protein
MMTAQTILHKAIGEKLVAPFDQKVKFCPVALTDDQRGILDDLLKLRTATLSRFEIETNRLGQGIGRELDALEAAGWVESQPTGSLLEPKVYYLSAKAIKLLLFSENN